jgi:hypothetical protein
LAGTARLIPELKRIGATGIGELPLNEGILARPLFWVLNEAAQSGACAH